LHFNTRAVSFASAALCLIPSKQYQNRTKRYEKVMKEKSFKDEKPAYVKMCVKIISYKQTIAINHLLINRTLFLNYYLFTFA